MQSIPWKELDYQEPYYFFVPKDFSESSKYENGFKIDELFTIFSTGAESQKDEVTIHYTEKELKAVLYDFEVLSENEIAKKYAICDGRDWKIGTSQTDVNSYKQIDLIQYRPFDIRHTLFSGKSKGFFAYTRYECLKHLKKPNFAITAVKLNRKYEDTTFWISKYITDKGIVSSLDNSYVFPLYLYPEPKVQQLVGQSDERIPNLNMGIVEAIANKINLHFIEDDMIDVELAEGSGGIFKPLDILGYTYAVLYSPTYREKYREFLKIDFPRIPYPKDQDTFEKLAELGIKLIQTHLLESKKSTKFITKYPIDGNNEVTKLHFDPDQSAVYINDTQYFANVPELAWNFFIGGYQPAQKWLKDRKGRHLEFDDIMHYQKIIVALTETDTLMKKIDLIEIE
jgi:predicted helicase